jgi:Fe2+ or Zn2+ uptake regulation protein
LAESDQIDALKGVLRAYGLHITAARLAVLQVLTQVPGHRSVEEIRAAVLARYPALDTVTIYRTLEHFEARGLAARVTLDDKLTRWERATPAHHHLICRSCGAVLEVEPEPFLRLAADLERAYGVRVEIRHLALRGLCPACVAAVA